MSNFLTDEMVLINAADSAVNREFRAVQVDFLPTALGDGETAALIERFDTDTANAADDANAAAAAVLAHCRPMLTDILPAMECVPGMQRNVILHPGAPVESFLQLSSAVQSAAAACAVHEGLAFTVDEAQEKLTNGSIKISSASLHSCAAALCSVISASTPVFCVKDKSGGNLAYAPLPAFGNKKISLGDCSDEAIDAMIKTEQQLVRPLREALLEKGEIDIFSIAAQGLMCGDDCCRRFSYCAGQLRQLFLMDIAESCSGELLSSLIEWLGDEQMFASLFLAALCCAMSSIDEMQDCTLFRSLVCDGKTLAARTVGNSEQWLYLPLKKEVICGDEVMCELFGLGSAAGSCAPQVLRACGISASDALVRMQNAYRCCSGQASAFKLPFANGSGSPICPDIRKMLKNCAPLCILALKGSGKPTIVNTGLSLQKAAMKSLCGE